MQVEEKNAIISSHSTLVAAFQSMEFSVGVLWGFWIAVIASSSSGVEAKSNNPVLLVSFDGLAAHHLEKFLSEHPTSNFQKFITGGVKAEYMIPAFPSSTFPNHWTLVSLFVVFGFV